MMRMFDLVFRSSTLQYIKPNALNACGMHQNGGSAFPSGQKQDCECYLKNVYIEFVYTALYVDSPRSRLYSATLSRHVLAYMENWLSKEKRPTDIILFKKED